MKLAAAEKDVLEKTNTLKLVSRVKDMYSDHIKKQREIIQSLDSQNVSTPVITRESRLRSPKVAKLDRSVSTVDVTPVRRRRQICQLGESYPSSVLEYRRARLSRALA